MSPKSQGKQWCALGAFLTFWALGVGCHVKPCMPDGSVPHESARVTHPPYVIEAPDVLLIDAVRLVPRPPYHIEPLDTLGIQVTDPATKGPLLPNEPIAGVFPVAPEGTVDLGFKYGSVPLAGLTLPEARRAIEDHLKTRFKPPFGIVVELVQSKAMQLIRGEHLVRPDGTVGLGTYGSVYVDGMTLEEAKFAVEQHLARFLLNPEISIDVSGFNSKVYYVIFDQDGAGQQVIRMPVTGKETVLDAIGELRGLPAGSNKRCIWVARPLPSDSKCSQVLPVDWQAITKAGSTATNYQLLPGDRVYVSVDPWVATDGYLAKVISPINRVLGVTLLGSSVVHSIAIPLGAFGTTGGTTR